MRRTYMKWGFHSYRLNRPVSKEERADRLYQNKPSPSFPWNQLSVIRMNSTYLECVDQLFAKRGGAIFGGLLVLFCLGYMSINTNIQNYELSQIRNLDLFDDWILPNLMDLPLLILAVWALKFEAFRLTHYPMRFNRKTRMVHLFRQDGTIMSEHWDKLFFTVGNLHDFNHEIRMHRLAEDGVTILETFALPYTTGRDDQDPYPVFYSQWEFVRRYMEEGPEKLIAQVAVTMDIHDKRETFGNGFTRVNLAFHENPVMLPFVLLCAIGRWIASHTSKIPVWPPEIETQCAFPPDDPYIRDEFHLAPIELVRQPEGWRKQ